MRRFNLVFYLLFLIFYFSLTRFVKIMVRVFYISFFIRVNKYLKCKN
nr:MAG TPA: hypothetical protein [Bacteriophage sp.]